MSAVVALPRATRPGLALVVADGLAPTLLRLLAGAGFEAVLDAGPSSRRPLAAGDVVVHAGDLDAIRELAAGLGDAALVAVMPAGSPRALLRKALHAGAAGLVLEDALESALAPTAVAAAAGLIAVPRALRRELAPRPLSHREKQVLALVAGGLTNRQIADRLYLGESTVKTHLSSAFDKLEVRSRAEVAALVLDREEGARLGVLELVGAERP